MSAEFINFGISAVAQTEQFAKLLCERIAVRLRIEPSEFSPILAMAADLQRIANHFDPPPPDKVGSDYVAQRLGCTTTWIADLVRRGEIPANCLVAGTGHGKPWKFHRQLIEKWIANR